MKLLLLVICLSASVSAKETNITLKYDEQLLLKNVIKEKKQLLKQVDKLREEISQLKDEVSQTNCSLQIEKLTYEIENLTSIVEKKDKELKQWGEISSEQQKQIQICIERFTVPENHLKKFMVNCLAAFDGLHTPQNVKISRDNCNEKASAYWAEFQRLKDIDQQGTWKDIPNYKKRQERFKELLKVFN